MRDELSGLGVVLAVADAGSFTRAAAALRVTPSAVSQTIDAVERRLGVRLFQRTTRRVGLTEAGARLVDALRPALGAVRDALDTAESARGRVSGTLRLTVPRLACPLVVEPLLGALLAEHPALRVELSIDDGLVDLVAGGFDAGIRLGEMVERDMIVVPMTGPLRSVIVASPAYLAAHGRPRHPRELVDHACINYRRITRRELYRWELVVDGRDVSFAVDGRLIVNDVDLLVRAAIDGHGLAYVTEPPASAAIADGRLVRVLRPFCPSYPGLHLYYPSRQAPPKLRALVDLIRRRAKAPSAQAAARRGARVARGKA